LVLAIDVGNTNIKCGIFKDSELLNSWRMTTTLDRTADEYGIAIVSIFSHVQHKPEEIRGIIISSVIPSINYTLEHMCSTYFNLKPLFVSPGIKTGMNIKYDNPKELGADRIVNAIAAHKIYGGPCIVVDFGTATTYGVIAANGDFLGGCIAPGLKISTDALTRSAAKLPRVELTKPDNVICRNTVHAMQAGIIYGYVGQVDYIIRRMKKELGSDALVIATGGLANLMAAETKAINEVNSLLTLKGLYYLYEKNTNIEREDVL
jgi:type III pantothenate kinase